MVLITVLAAALAVAAQEAAAPPQTEAPALEATPAAPAAEPGAAQAAIDAGLQAFKKRRFAQAEAAFSKALEAEPLNPAANFYLGYTFYKIAEPSRRLTTNKQKAAALFAKAYELDPTFKPVWYRRN
jgi:tetratricopeptide (TPR) repeat protein